MTEPTAHAIWSAALGLVALALTIFALACYLSYRLPLTPGI